MTSLVDHPVLGTRTFTTHLGNELVATAHALCHSPAMSTLVATARTIFRQRDFLVLLGCNVILGLAYSFVVPFLSIFGTKEVGMSPLRFGVFMTVTSILGVGASTYLARASDTVLPRKSVLLLGGIAGALGYAGYALVRDFWILLFIGATVLGVASVTFGQVFAYARDLLTSKGIEQREFPLYMNVFRLAFALAWTVGPAWAAWMMMRYSFEGTFLFASGLFLLFVLGVAFFIPKVPPSQKAQAAAEAQPLRRVLLDPMVLAHFIAFSVFFVCSTMAMMNLPLLILNTLRGTEAQVGWAFSVAPVFELPFMFYLGVLATRVSHAVLIRTALVVATVYYVGLAVVGAPYQIYPLQILGAAIVAVMNGVAITFFQNFLPDQPGTATNLYATAQRIGSTLGYLLFGTLMDFAGHRAIFHVCALGAFSSFVLLHLARSRNVGDASIEAA